MTKAVEKKKVAILGGGVGAMAAAFALTNVPDAANRFDITLYQMGWRLGGKGASGRNAKDNQRIEEHGLHVWSGFYHNAMTMMRECLAEAGDQEGVFRSFEETFTPHSNILLTENVNGTWRDWSLKPVVKDSEPGIGPVDLSPMGLFKGFVEQVRHMIGQADKDRKTPVARPAETISEPLAAHLRNVVDPGSADWDSAHGLLHGALQGMPDRAEAVTPMDRAALHHLAAEAQKDQQEQTALREAHGEMSDEDRRFRVMIDMGTTAVKGMIADGVIWKGFDALDDEEFSDWLSRHGAREETINSALVKAVYDYVFGYRDGVTDREHRCVAAGTFLKGSMLLMLTYKGSIFYKMNAGMGDAIFTPLHKVLKKRGVKFKFFHRVVALHLNDSETAIARISLNRQADVKDDDYDPYVRIKGLDCWPSEPKWAELEDFRHLTDPNINFESIMPNGERSEPLTLTAGQDFDEVILGISMGSLPRVAGELIEADPAWRLMVDKVTTVATQSMQLWMKSTAGRLGWPEGDATITAFADDLNTCADMSQLGKCEEWGEGDYPSTIAYFCGPLPDSQRLELGSVERMGWRWFERYAEHLFPGAFLDNGSFNKSRLVGVPDWSQTRWSTQYFRANTQGSELYVMSAPGSTAARLRADRSGFANLWLAGDWTYTGINAGCVEAATMSGMRAAAGLAGVVPQIVGEDADPQRDNVYAPGFVAPMLKSIKPQNSNWPWSSVFGQAETTGAAVTLPFPRDVVQKMLPAGLELLEPGAKGGGVPKDVAPKGTHPVILLFARQQDVRPNLFPFGMAYNEFICAVPWVGHSAANLKGQLPPLICPTRLYLDRLFPILLGIYGFGFPKERADIAAAFNPVASAAKQGSDRGTYVIRDPAGGAQILSCRFDTRGPATRQHLLPKFKSMAMAFEMPMVTRNKLGQWQYSVYDFSMGQAMIQPISMEIRVADGRLGLPQGAYYAPSIAEEPLGAFFVTADATINNPFQSFSLLSALKSKKQSSDPKPKT